MSIALDDPNFDVCDKQRSGQPQKIADSELESFTRWEYGPDTKRISISIKCESSMHFAMFTCHGTGTERKKLSFICIMGKRHGTSHNYLRIAASKATKKGFFVELLMGTKNGYLTITLSIGKHGWKRMNRFIIVRMQYIFFQGNAMFLEGPEGCDPLRSAA